MNLDDLANAPPPSAQAAQQMPSEQIQREQGYATLDDLANAPPPSAPPPQISATGNSIEPTSGWSKGWKNFAAHFALGGGAISKGVLGLGLAATDQPLDEVTQELQTQSQLQAQHDAEDYGNVHGFNLMASKLGGTLTEQLPTMGLGAGVMATGGVVATIFGAPIIIGAATGAAALFGTLAVGQHMYDVMHDHGVDRNNARIGALANGAMNAAIAFGSSFVGGKGITQAGTAMITSATVKAALADTVKRIATTSGVQIAGAEVSALTDSVIKYITTRTSTSATPFTYQEAIDEMKRATVQAFTTAPLLSAGGETLGLAGGRFFRDHVERTRAITNWLDNESKAIEQKHTQQMYSSAQAVMQSPLTVQQKVSAVRILTTQAERNSLVEKAVLAAKVKKGANPNQGDPTLAANPLETKERLQGNIEKVAAKIVPWSDTFGQPFVNQEGLLVIAAQDVPNPHEITEPFSTSKAVAEAGRLRLEYSDKYYGHMNKATGLSNAKIQDLEHQAFGKDITITSDMAYKDSHGSTHTTQKTITLSAGETISYLLWKDNQDAQAALLEPFHETSDGMKLGNGFTADTFQKLEGALYDANPQYLNAIVGLKAFYDEMGPILKKDYETLNPGEILHLQTDYGGKIVRHGATEVNVDPDKLIPLMPGGDLKNPSFTVKRGPSLVFIKPMDAFANAGSRVRQQAQWRAMAPEAPLWAQLMASKSYKHALDTKYPGLHQSIKQSYVRIISGRTGIEGSKWLNGVMKARSFSKLAGKPVQMGKHAATLVNFSLHEFRGQSIPGADFTAGVLYFHAHPVAVAKMVMDWPEVKVRYANPEKILAQLNADSMSPNEVRTQRFFMKPFELGDQYALIGGSNAIYKWVLKETGDPVLAKAEAVKAFRNVLASGEADQQSSIGSHPWGKVATQFKQPEMRLAQTVVERWRTAANFPTPENVQRAVRTHLLSAVAAGLFVLPETLVATGAAALGGKQEQASEKWFRFGQRLFNGNMFPLMDDAIINAEAVVVNEAEKQTGIGEGKHKVWDFTVAPADSLKSSIELVKDQIAFIEGKGSVHLAYKTLLDAIGTANLVGKGAPEAPIRGADWLSQILGLE